MVKVSICSSMFGDSERLCFGMDWEAISCLFEVSEISEHTSVLVVEIDLVSTFVISYIFSKISTIIIQKSQ